MKTTATIVPMIITVKTINRGKVKTVDAEDRVGSVVAGRGVGVGSKNEAYMTGAMESK